MEDKKEIKLKLGFVIFLVLLLAIIIAGVLVFILNKNAENQNVNAMAANQTIIPVITDEPETPTEKPSVTGEELEGVDFALKFLKLENEKKNIIYSPLSIKYALSLLNEGAAGNTKEQIEELIEDTSLTKYENIKDILSLANAVYIRNTYSEYVKDEYINTVANKYNSEIKYDEFKDAKNMNEWIEDKTFGQIKDMIADNIVQNEDNKMILINSLAIDMEWNEKFDAEDTHEGVFNLANGKEMKATMMNMETTSNNASYYKDDNVTMLAMDLKKYEDTQLEFIAIMPKEDLSGYIETVKTEEINKMIKSLTLASETKKGLNISIPRFSYDYDLSLKDDLKALGIKDAFIADIADFSKMSKESLYVGGALHKANIDFTEKGVKAAATTVIYLTAGMVAVDEVPIEIKIDNPFMYLIRDKKTGEIWFVGAVYEPNSWENDKVNYEYR